LEISKYGNHEHFINKLWPTYKNANHHPFLLFFVIILSEMNRIKQAFSSKQEPNGSRKRFSLFSKDAVDKRFSVQEQPTFKSKNPSLAIATSDIQQHSQPRSAHASRSNFSDSDLQPTKSQKRHSMFQSAKDISPIPQRTTDTLISPSNNALISPAVASDSTANRSSSLRRGKSLIVPPRRKSTRVSKAISSANEKIDSLPEEPESSEPRHAPAPQADDGSSTPQADEYLQLGVQYHESGKLEKATHYWRMAAERDHPLGLFFYGIALRHGWVSLRFIK
jgi:hypothetical protein